jgi:microcin C transport system ATP-binding protein
MAMLFITHDLNIVRKLAHRICVMQQGRIVESGPVEQVFTAPQHDYTRHLLAAEPKGDPAQPPPDARTVLAARDLRVWFPIKAGVFRHTVGHVKAVDGIDVSVREGHTLGVVGESGSGKTTLGLALLRLESSKGTIEFDGRAIQDLRASELRPLRKEMQIVFQDPFGSLSPRLSVGEIVAEGLRIHDIGTADEREAMIVDVLREVRLDPETRHRYPHEFSGGQRQRIAIARALVLKPRLLILDEPTSALGARESRNVLRLIQDAPNHGVSVIVISHNLEHIMQVADRAVVLRQGNVVGEAEPNQENHERLVSMIVGGGADEPVGDEEPTEVRADEDTERDG